MRQFKLWNSTKTSSFDFTVMKCIISDVSGLGLSFKSVINNRTLVDHQREFDEVSLLVNFGVGANAYSTFNSFANFIASNGLNSFVLEYAANDRTVYADVWLKRIPKSQKTQFNILSETVQFTRMSHWYQLVTGEVPVSPGYAEIVNDFFEEIKIHLTIRSGTTNDFRVISKDLSGQTVSEIIVPTQILLGTLTLDAEAKYVDRFTGGVHSNGYNLVSREGDTFLILEKGTYRISTNNAATNQPLYTFKKWVID